MASAKKAKANKFIIQRPDDETLTVFLNGVEVASANHDSDGWSGMQSVEDTVKAIAGVLNIPVEEGSDDEENEDEAAG